MKRIAWIVAALLGALAARAQPGSPDLLRAALAGARTDTARFSACSDLAFALAGTAPDSALRYVREEERLARKIGQPRYAAAALNDLAIVQYFTGDFSAALRNNEAALAIRRRIGDPALVLSSVNKIAIIHQTLGSYELATRDQLEALKLAERLHDESAVGKTLNNLSLLLLRVKRYDEALRYSRQAAEMAARLRDTPVLASDLQQIGSIFQEQGRIDSAEWYQRRTIGLLEPAGPTIDLAVAYSNMGFLERARYRDAEGIAYYRKALAIARELDNDNEIAAYAANLGSALIDVHRPDEAFRMLELARSRADDGMREVQKTIVASLLSYYIVKRQPDSAIRYMNRYRDLIDTLYSAASAQQINELYSRYETGRKEQQIELLARQNTIKQLTIGRKNALLLATLLCALALAGVGFLLYNRRRLRQQSAHDRELARQRQEASRAVVAAEETERQRIAGDLHDGIGQLFSAVKLNLSGIADRHSVAPGPDRHLLDNTLALVDESCRELRVISHQMMPNALLRSGLLTAVRDFINKVDEHRLKITLGTDGLRDSLDPGAETVLYRIIQESVNNVIRHARATRLDIQLSNDQEQVTVTIEDNGVGFDRSRIKAGIGLKNMEARVAFLDGKIDYETAPDKGTFIAIYLPHRKTGL